MRRWAALLMPLALAGCGLQPLYAGGASGPVATTLASVEVGPIAGQDGWLMRHALEERLHAGGDAPPRYRLLVDLDDQIGSLGVRADNVVTRERRTLRARFRLVTADPAATTLLDATAGSDAGIDVVSSDYATLAAEQSALENLVKRVADQIVARVALYARAQRAG